MGELIERASGPAPRVLVLGSCILDLQLFVNRLPVHGESLVARGGGRLLGGKGFNQAVGLARLGCDVTLVSGIGQDEIAQSFLMRAKDEGIDFRPGVVASTPTGVAAPLVTPDGVSTIVVDVGASMHLSPEHVEDVIRAGRWDIALCHYEVPTDSLCRLYDVCEALGVPVMCNPAPWIGERALDFARRAAIVVLNSVEAGSLARDAGIGSERLASPTAVARACAETCRGELLVLTLGKDGSVAVTHEDVRTYEPFSVNAVDSTGAGDAFCAGLAYGVLNGWTQTHALLLASATAALACSKHGGADAMPYLNSAIALASTHTWWSLA